ncbi:transglutaminase domain-containing protein [Thermosipho ferrireducens]|uniref:Transglutaminase domain-containing protein n=1 Tax=Thermosipho ferrireducens TaxID=2571116 RepID=A0ABX7S5F0_9BACT|nr:transglutaminase domain-containing protein [Thermosipho ferrireducens]QTA37759.1 transglutaminase domain-containing protein [Thermosipho ferrireducens]
MEFLTVNLPENILREESSGNFGKALRLIDKMLKKNLPELLKNRLLFEKERINRLLIDYPHTLEDAIKIARDKIRGFTEVDFERLLYEGELDYIYVDGQLRFEKRFAENIGFALENYRKQVVVKKEVEQSRRLLNNRLKALLKGGKPKQYKVRARINVFPDYNEISGKTIKVWLPIPKDGFQISNAKVISTSHKNYKISPETSPQKTIYFEDKLKSRKEFYVEFEYEIREWINKVESEKVKEDIPESVEKYLVEKPPHIVFTPYLKHLTGEIIKNEKNPYVKAKLIYDWITLNVSYSYVRPYATYETIPEFVATNLKGDCGFQALLFITMCRIAGIPARWQSGWFINKYLASPHDWALFYINPYGWLPADLSFGGARKQYAKMRNFYFGNLDGFRMVANVELMEPFYPEKKFWRSDPYDNQVGEIETEYENIYYDKFSYSIKIQNFSEVK